MKAITEKRACCNRQIKNNLQGYYTAKEEEMSNERLLEVAYKLEEITLRLEEELAQARLKAGEEAGILGYSSYSNGFHVTEERFLEIANGDAFTIKERDSDCYKYEYQYFVNGRMFFCISDKFWGFDKPKEEDKESIVKEEER